MYQAAILKQNYPSEPKIWIKEGNFKTWKQAREYAEVIADQTYRTHTYIGAYTCYWPVVLDENENIIE